MMSPNRDLGFGVPSHSAEKAECGFGAAAPPLDEIGLLLDDQVELLTERPSDRRR